MKRPCTLLAALLLPLCASAADQVWRADLATTEVRNLYLRHGESADLTARLFLRGTPYAPTNAVAYYQTNGMAQAWWSAPCSIASNTVSVAWTPALDPGADLVSLLIRLDDSAYRAAAMLYLRPSPGAAPNVLPPPTQWLDFDKIAWTNAPWALPADVDLAITAAVGAIPTPDFSATNADLVATIQAVAPAPGDYATVSNRAMSALQSYTETDPTVPAWAKEQNAPAEIDPTVPAWAKAANKPVYTPAEVGAAASSHQHASTDVTGLAAVATSGSYADLSGKPAIPTVPSVVSAFRNDAGYINASTATNIAENVGGGGVDDQTVSNLIARVLSEAGASAAATEIWRIILADHQRRLDALEDADGTDALTEAQAEAIVDAKCETWATNAIAPAVEAYRSAMQAANEAAAAYVAAGSPMPSSTDEIEATAYTSSSAVSIEVSPTVATRYYRSADASSSLSISSFTGANNNPSWLLLSGYGSVSWPSGSAYAGSAYPGTEGGVFRIFKLNSQIYIERVY